MLLKLMDSEEVEWDNYRNLKSKNAASYYCRIPTLIKPFCLKVFLYLVNLETVMRTKKAIKSSPSNDTCGGKVMCVFIMYSSLDIVES